MAAGSEVRSGAMTRLMILWALAALMAVPLWMVHGVVVERNAYHARVIADIAHGTAGDQTVVGPLLLVRYRERVRPHEGAGAGGRPAEAERIVQRDLVVVPESLAIEAHASVEARYRGIYHTQLVHSRNSLAAAFRVAPRYGLPDTRDILGFDPPLLVVGIADARGLRRTPTVTIDGRAAEVRPGAELVLRTPGGSGRSGDLGLRQGFSAPLPGALESGGTFRAAIALDLIGTRSLAFSPVGRESRIEMRSPWPHPSFTGEFLPERRSVGRDGFTAGWQLSDFATNVETAVRQYSEADGPPGREAGGQPVGGVLQLPSVGAEFIQPVDVYQQSERAVKYGMLFIGLTFVAFFLFEVLRRLEIHPVQYALVGLALAVFFLLVISLSEHIPFAAAYLIASAGCVGLIAFYVGHVMRGAARGLGVGAMLGVLYAVLYVLLQSEDFALLLGSLLVFGVLALVMIVTRRFDWYRMKPAAAAPLQD